MSFCDESPLRRLSEPSRTSNTRRSFFFFIPASHVFFFSFSFSEQPRHALDPCDKSGVGPIMPRKHSAANQLPVEVLQNRNAVGFVLLLLFFFPQLCKRNIFLDRGRGCDLLIMSAFSKQNKTSAWKEKKKKNEAAHFNNSRVAS